MTSTRFGDHISEKFKEWCIRSEPRWWKLHDCSQKFVLSALLLPLADRGQWLRLNDTILLMLTSKLERMHLLYGSAKVMLTLNFHKKFLITYYIVTCRLLITANSFSLNSLSAIHLHFNSLKQHIEPGCGLLPLEIMLLLAGCYLKFVLTPAAETACLSCLPSA